MSHEEWIFDPSLKCLEIDSPEAVEIKVSYDKKIVWINTEDGCRVRISRIKSITFTHDEEVDESEGC